jgi:hypothetical protein
LGGCCQLLLLLLLGGACARELLPAVWILVRRSRACGLLRLRTTADDVHCRPLRRCAVKQLDPTNKFASASDVWHWRATRGGADVPLEQCCGAEGFDYQACVCAPRQGCQE